MKKLTLVAVLLLAGSVLSAAPAAANPSAPTNVVVVSTSPAGTGLNAATVRVTWRASTNAVSYAVSASATGQTTRLGSTSVCQASNCNSTVVDLAGGVPYSFVVTAIDSSGREAAAAAVSFTPTSIPAAPIATSATVSNGQVVLSWTAPTNNGGQPLTGYKISASNVDTITIDPDAVSYTVTGLTIGSAYTFSILATNSVGNSAIDTFAQVTVSSAPSAPAAPSATVSGSSITASWNTPANNGSTITGYSVYLVSSSGSDVGQPIAPSPATSTSATFTNVAAGTYTVQVLAIAGSLQSPRSANSPQVTVQGGSLDNTPVFSPSLLPNLDIGDTQAVSITAPSGGQVTVSVTAESNGVCTYSSGVITAVASGTCTISASVPANATYAAGEGSKSFTVKLSQSITFSTIDNQASPGSLNLSAVASSGLSVRYSASGACTIAGSTVTFTSSGNCTITASQPGNGRYSAAQTVTRTFAVNSSSGGGGGGGFGSGPGGPTGPGAGSSASGGNSAVGAPSIPRESRSRSDYLTLTDSGRATRSVRLSSDNASTSIRLGQSVRASLSGLSRGTRVSTTISTPDNKVFTLRARTVGSSRAFSSSIIKPKTKGNYTVTVSYGKIKRTLIVRVN